MIIKPIKGGNPPNDKIFNNIINFIKGLMLLIEYDWLIWKIFVKLNNIINIIFIILYKIKYIFHNIFLINIDINIQPKFVILEYPIIIRTIVWLIPIILPIVIDIIKIIYIIFLFI